MSPSNTVKLPKVMDRFTPSEPLSFEGSIAEQCGRKWKQELTLYITAAEKDKKSDLVKSSVLLTCIGKKAREIYNTFTFENDDENMKFNIIIEKFDEYCFPERTSLSGVTSSSHAVKKKVSPLINLLPS